MQKRDIDIRLQMEEYRKELSTMTQIQLNQEWNRVMLWLNPDSSIKERIGEIYEQ